MKRTLLLVTLGVLFCCSAAIGQFNQGRWLAGGSVNFSATTSKSESGGTVTTDSKSTGFGLGPNIGYFFMDNLAAGAQLTVGTSKTKSEAFDYTSTSNSSYIGPFVRYYLPMSLFFQGTVAFGSSHSKYESSTSNFESKYSLMNWGLGVGYAYFLNDYVALEPIVGYRSNTMKNKDTEAKDIDGIIYLSAALTVYLGERK